MTKQKGALKKELKLFDVFAISIGAMFSSGFFLLPGIAMAQTGPSVVLAYLLGGLLVMPTMFCLAELSTALPKAGGSYYFLDRSLGPLFGTLGGIGNWFTMVFKSLFSLVGMGAYLLLFFDLDIDLLAIILTLAFTLINMVGAKYTARLQVTLVVIPLIIISFFLIAGLLGVFSHNVIELHSQQFSPFMPEGAEGLAATIGLVFISYGGMKKVASVAEEVQNPERNIPMGMFLSLLAAIIIYVLGVYIMVSLLEPEEMSGNLTPVAAAARQLPDWIPAGFGVLMVVIAAISAFASTANAGIMSASRFPMAMARDQLIWNKLSHIGRFNTPTIALTVTCASMILFVVLLDIEGVAKLGSAFTLLTFGLVNFAQIVMKESRIESYDPGFTVPFYPWTPIAGILISIWLIIQIGILSILFTAGVTVVSVLWYIYYARNRVYRDGAIYHIFERLGRSRYEQPDMEAYSIVKEDGIGESDPFDQVVSRAHIIDVKKYQFDQLFQDVAVSLAERLPSKADQITETLQTTPEDLIEGFTEESGMGGTVVTNGVVLTNLRIHGIEHPEMVLVRCREGLHPKHWDEWYASHESGPNCYAIIFLVSPAEKPAQHLRFLSQLASRVEQRDFLYQWLGAETDQELKELLLYDNHFYSLQLERDQLTRVLINQPIKDIGIPDQCLIAMVYRDGHVIIPTGQTRLREGDRLTILGSPESILQLSRQYG